MSGWRVNRAKEARIAEPVKIKKKVSNKCPDIAFLLRRCISILEKKRGCDATPCDFLRLAAPKQWSRFVAGGLVAIAKVAEAF